MLNDTIAILHIGHLQRFEIIVWLPATNDILIRIKREPLLRPGPEAQYELAYLLPDPRAPLLDVYVPSARDELDIDAMPSWLRGSLTTGQTESVIHLKERVKKVLVLFVIHNPGQYELIESLYPSDPSYPEISEPIGEVMRADHEFSQRPLVTLFTLFD